MNGVALTPSGSGRQYFRVADNNGTRILVQGTDRDENRAFIELSRHFRSKGIKVPEVLEVSDDLMSYYQEDLGDNLLFGLLSNGRQTGEYNEFETNLLLKTIAALPKIQYEGAEGLDFSICYPDREFNARMVDFDLNYFKYCFLKLSDIEFNEIKLQNDFDEMKADLLRDPGRTFMYRDFQSRNVIIKDGEPWFIDFQGGRRGPIHYDVASFISQARARYSSELKDRLIDTYLEALAKYDKVEAQAFRKELKAFILLRTLQVLGAYGYRGLIQKKPHFISSIPFAIENIKELMKDTGGKYPYLFSILEKLVEKYSQTEKESPAEGVLTVKVMSFSYKKGLPEDESANGGGYIFDCRSIPNPGRLEQYKDLTGMDKSVIEFIENNSEAEVFLSHAFSLVDKHISRYQQRGFTHLQVCFGCTGGQHRSVYCAERMRKHIKEKFPEVNVELTHREREL